MHRLRRLNNFVKALVLDAFCVRKTTPADAAGDAAAVLGVLRQPVPEAAPKSPPSDYPFFDGRSAS